MAVEELVLVCGHQSQTDTCPLGCPRPTSLKDLPALPNEIISKQLEMIKKEFNDNDKKLIERMESIEKDIPEMIDTELERRSTESFLKWRKRFKYFIGSMPGSIFGIVYAIIESMP